MTFEDLRELSESRLQAKTAQQEMQVGVVSRSTEDLFSEQSEVIPAAQSGSSESSDVLNVMLSRTRDSIDWFTELVDMDRRHTVQMFEQKLATTADLNGSSHLNSQPR